MEIDQKVSEAGRYEQLAEEAVELAHAAMKKARILRGENPTPMISSVADAYIIEEYSDVMVCIKMLGISTDEDMMKQKEERWINRLNNWREEQ